jgi:hypothetical protein
MYLTDCVALQPILDCTLDRLTKSSKENEEICLSDLNEKYLKYVSRYDLNEKYLF